MRMLLRRAQTTLIPELEVAETFWARMKGLLGRTHMAEDQALWILKCNSIHTFFMKFPIDVVFVDREMVVRKTYSRLRPGRLVMPVWNAHSVIEFSAGFLEKHPVAIGEQLHVDRSFS